MSPDPAALDALLWAVLADLADMHRPPDPTRWSAVIDPICCQECAR